MVSRWPKSEAPLFRKRVNSTMPHVCNIYYSIYGIMAVVITTRHTFALVADALVSEGKTLTLPMSMANCLLIQGVGEGKSSTISLNFYNGRFFH